MTTENSTAWWLAALDIAGAVAIPLTIWFFLGSFALRKAIEDPSIIVLSFVAGAAIISAVHEYERQRRSFTKSTNLVSILRVIRNTEIIILAAILLLAEMFSRWRT